MFLPQEHQGFKRLRCALSGLLAAWFVAFLDLAIKSEQGAAAEPALLVGWLAGWLAWWLPRRLAAREGLLLVLSFGGFLIWMTGLQTQQPG